MTSIKHTSENRFAIFLRRSVKRSLKVFIAILVLYFLIALGLIYWPRSALFEDTPNIANYSHTISASEQFDRIKKIPSTELTVQARDGTDLSLTRYSKDSGMNILFLHGVTSNQKQMSIPARLLAHATGHNVITLDFRGHGQSAGRRYDVDYIGQYEDDIEDVLNALKDEFPRQEFILSGHSMGGGVALRYALKENAPSPSAYILYAPNFGEGPTQRKNTKERDKSEAETDSFVHFDVPRMIGQLMMNTAGLHMFDHKPILYFNFLPERQAYSYRSVMSAQPIRPQTADIALASINVPLLVIVGEEDEVFEASAYPAFVSAHSQGQTHLINSEDHTSILFSEAGYAQTQMWLMNSGFEIQGQ